MSLMIASVNVNGLRAAMRKGMTQWLEEYSPDLVAIQETRAPNEVVQQLLSPSRHIAHAEAARSGRAGVAIASDTPLRDVTTSLGPQRFADSGRWVEATIDTSDGRCLTVVSSYVFTGEATDAPRMDEKHAFVRAAIERLTALRETGRHVLLTGDLNIARTQMDIKNWKGNVGKSGFLPEERAHLDHLCDELGWIDLGRQFGGDGPGPYTWWSYRGQAFDNDAGWRIDYLVATPALAALAKDVEVHRAATYAERWSDHAPISATFDL